MHIIFNPPHGNKSHGEKSKKERADTVRFPSQGGNETVSAPVYVGAPDWIRTSRLQSRSLTLYPNELQAHIK